MLGANENTEEKIIKATFDILKREGVQKATTKKIAAEAGVNEVTIFRKFENKKNLIEATKEHYMNILVNKLDENFSFSEDDEIEEYLKRSYNGFLEFSEEDFSIIKVAMQEVSNAPDKKLLMSQIFDTIIKKLVEFFELQAEKGEIKDINPKAIAIMCFSMIFQSSILFQIYGEREGIESNDMFAKDLLEILFNGIKP